MNLINFLEQIMSGLNDLENKINKTSKFNPRELNEILQNAKQENVQFLESLSKINKLSAFDISFLLSSVELDSQKIEIIKKASEIYSEEEFKGQGQTFSDFMFRVASNINFLNENNLELFKDLAQCKTDVYNFAEVLKNPNKYLTKHKKDQAFAFQKVLY